MTLAIRQVDPASEGERILEVLARNLPAASSRSRFDWLYLDNPQGESLVWLAEDQSGRAVGTSAAHSRSFAVEGTTLPALVLGDFAFDAEYRSLGPALRLLRATLLPVQEGNFALAYDYPSAAMRAVDTRVGMTPLASTERWIFPMSIAPTVERAIRSERIASALAKIGDPLLRATRGHTADDCSVCIDSSPQTTDYGELGTRQIPDARIHGRRDTDYLAWRLRCPIWPHTLLRAERSGELLGFAMLREVDRSSVEVLDLRVSAPGAAAALLSAAATHAADNGASQLSLETSQAGPAAEVAKALGFIRREAHAGPLIAVAPGHPEAATLHRSELWWLTGGDRDA